MILKSSVTGRTSENKEKNSAREAFASGNYSQSLTDSRGLDQELFYMSQIMCGSIPKGLDLLGKIGELSNDAKIVQAYAEWSLTGKVSSCLKGIPSGKTVDLLIFSMPNHSIVKYFQMSKLFNVHSVQINSKKFGKTLEEVLAETPDSFNPVMGLSIDCYGPFLPREMEKRKFPLVFWASDHDYFFSTRYADLMSADLIVVNSSAEQIEMSRCYPARVVSFPLHDNYFQYISNQLLEKEREIDIIVTGRPFVPYMRDKAETIFNLCCSQNDDAKIRIYNGYFTTDEFIKRLATTKATISYSRYSGGIQTRTIHAARTGVKILGLEENLLDYFIDPLKNGSPDKLDYSLVLKANLEKLGDLFPNSPIREERFVKFCIFQNWQLSAKKYNQKSEKIVPVEMRGYDVSTGIKIYNSIIKDNLERSDTPQKYNVAGSAAFYSTILAQNSQKLAQICLEIYKEGYHRYPLNLVLGFNYACALWSFGNKQSAKIVFGKLSRVNSTWDYSPNRDSLLSHRLRSLADIFPYGDYYRLSVNSFVNSDERKTPIDIIRSTCFVYLAIFAYEEGDFHGALKFLTKANLLFRYNYWSYRLETKVRTRIESDCSLISKAFYNATKLYPPVISEILEEGITSEIKMGNTSKATNILEKFILVFGRIYEVDESRSELPHSTVETIRNHMHLLSDNCSKLAKKIITNK